MIDVTSEEYALYLEILSQIDHPFEDIMEESQISLSSKEYNRISSPTSL